jgi:hypothetical protein
MLKQIMDATGDAFPILEIGLYATCVGLGALYYFRDLDHPELSKKALPPKKARPVVAHKGS